MNGKYIKEGQGEGLYEDNCYLEEPGALLDGDSSVLEVNTHDATSQEDLVSCCPEELETLPNGDPSFLEVNVHDAISNKDLGPGQKQ